MIAKITEPEMMKYICKTKGSCIQLHDAIEREFLGGYIEWLLEDSKILEIKLMPRLQSYELQNNGSAEAIIELDFLTSTNDKEIIIAELKTKLCTDSRDKFNIGNTTFSLLDSDLVKDTKNDKE